jgi:hypothetical protein
MSLAIWCGLGVLSGAGHGIGLWRAAYDAQSLVPWAFVRLTGVGVVLVAAALMGGLLPAVAGWAGGLVAAGVLLCFGSTRCIR